MYTAAKKFIQIERARKVLVDKDMRQKYDQWRSGGFKMVVSFDEWLAIQPRVHTVSRIITKPGSHYSQMLLYNRMCMCCNAYVRWYNFVAYYDTTLLCVLAVFVVSTLDNNKKGQTIPS